MSDVQRCPKCGGEVDMEFLPADKTTTHHVAIFRLGGRRTFRTKMLRCKVCGYRFHIGK